MVPTILQGRRRPALMAGAVAGILFLAACGGGSGGSGTSGAGASADVLAQAQQYVKDASKPVSWPVPTTPVPNPVDLSGKTVAIIPMSDKIPLMHGVAVGMQEALKALGADSYICDGGANPSTMADCLKTAGDRKVAAAVPLFMDYEPLANAIDALNARGVPVLLEGVAASPKKKADSLLAYGDNTASLAAEYGDVAYQAINAGGADTHLLVGRLRDSTMTTGFSDAAINKFKQLCPGCEINTIDFTTSGLDKLPTAISAALTAHPKTNVVFVPPDSFVPSAVQGIQAAGFTSKVKLVGTGADPSGLARVAAGTEVTTSGVSTEFEGWRATNHLMQMLAGAPVTPSTESDARVFTKDVVTSLGTVQQNDYFTSVWFGGDSFKADYLKVWGKG